MEPGGPLGGLGGFGNWEGAHDFQLQLSYDSCTLKSREGLGVGCTRSAGPLVRRVSPRPEMRAVPRGSVWAAAGLLAGRAVPRPVPGLPTRLQ